MNRTNAPMASATISPEMTVSAMSEAPTPSAMAIIAKRGEPSRCEVEHLVGHV